MAETHAIRIAADTELLGAILGDLAEDVEVRREAVTPGEREGLAADPFTIAVGAATIVIGVGELVKLSRTAARGIKRWFGNKKDVDAVEISVGNPLQPQLATIPRGMSEEELVALLEDYFRDAQERENDSS